MTKPLRFIDLFAGIGGFRLALENIGAECVFSSEIDEHAIHMYKENYGDDPRCDITTLDPHSIPDFEILCAGFPCQAFSISGKQLGFKDEARGTLFFDICRVLQVKQPQAFILENVQNLVKHDKGNTIFIMLKALDELGYTVKYEVLNAKDFGVPQNRERIIIVGSREGKSFDFSKLVKHPVSSMYEFLDPADEEQYLEPSEYTLLSAEQLREQKSGLLFCGYRNKALRSVGVREGTAHLSRSHKQPNRIYSARGIHPTIASQEQSGRYFILVDGRVRKLTLNECFKFMGFPADFKKVGSASKLYERIGNSVCVPMIQAVAQEVVDQLFLSRDLFSFSPEYYMDGVYKDALEVESSEELNLSPIQRDYIETIVSKEETHKGVFTVLVTSLVYKHLHPEQDIRYHQSGMENGYSGRTFDTKHVTPFLKQKQFIGAMRESGWLTRSLEQNFPYTLDFPGKVSNPRVKEAFLRILRDVQVMGASANEYLKGIFYLSIKNKQEKSVVVNPVSPESKLSIKDIIYLLKEHFDYRYHTRGASILPVLAIHSIYQCLVKEFDRYKDKQLEPLGSHYSSDFRSGSIGDITVTNRDGSYYEAVEVKFNKRPDVFMILDAFRKFANTSVQRFYILSTQDPDSDELQKINKEISNIEKQHGCQVIVNGVINTIQYFLRSIKDPKDFLDNYVNHLQTNSEIGSEFKISWNALYNSFLINK